MNNPSPPSVPLLDLKAQYATIKDEIKAAIEPVIESQQFIMGPAVGELEAAIAQYVGARFAIGCASGSDAILLAMMALGIGRDHEVICPSYTFFATGGYITKVGAKPVYADIDPVTYNMDPDHVRTLARKCKRLKAIMPVHLFGQAADMEAYIQIGEEFGVPIVEDAAQAIGARDEQGIRVGTRSAISCFSFFPSKNLGAFGDGGILTTNDPDLADRLSILRVHGGRPKYYHKYIGVNSRLDSLQAAVLKVKLKHLDQWTRGRQSNAAYYDKKFKAAGAQTSQVPLSSGSGLPLRTPHPAGAQRPGMAMPGPSHIYNQYVIRVPADLRDPLRAHLTEHKIGTEIYYPVPLHLQECFAYLGYRKGDLPESEAAADQTIALPIYPELTRAQLDHVAGTITQFITQQAVAAR
ncbi:MAG: DegT/DnrJ/EryC1/StrS family aminotransferase [Phycisphaerales bacterium]|nr:DegT/DnrJ/EryC1/StrS family aminotransferase [Phycisphaerales bacterium]MCI0631921.1 DegT/DnrJ/EryC1/StrS family aminotransferase [Phycisphaerales bacterium]MCI0675792.1 DegT/DnrJ/EryC1/StrS family aminotransferase [Phycisphaerales bacterium]